jgi:hypothetical protein
MSCDDFARNKTRLRELAVRPQVSNGEHWRLFDYCPFSIEPIREATLDISRKIITDPPDDLDTDMHSHGVTPRALAADWQLPLSYQAKRPLSPYGPFATCQHIQGTSASESIAEVGLPGCKDRF